MKEPDFLKMAQLQDIQRIKAQDKLSTKDIIFLIENLSEIKAISAAENFMTTFEAEIKKYILKTVDKLVNDTIKYKLSSLGLKEIIDQEIKEKIRSSTVKEVVQAVSEGVLLKIHKKLDEELKNAKSLAYSIDTEVKHIMHNTDISPETTRAVNEVIFNILRDRQSQILLTPEKDILLLNDETAEIMGGK